MFSYLHYKQCKQVDIKDDIYWVQTYILTISKSWEYKMWLTISEWWKERMDGEMNRRQHGRKDSGKESWREGIRAIW